MLDRYCASVSTHSLRYCIGEYDISVCVSPPMPSNRTQWATETHGPRRQNVTTKWGRHFYSRSAVQTAGVTRVDIKGTPPPSTLRGASITDKPGKRMPACQRDRPAVEIWHADLQHWLSRCNGATERSQASYDFISRSLITQHGRDRAETGC